MLPIARAQWIEAETSELVATLPDLPIERLAALAVALRELAAATAGAPARTAELLARVVDQYRDGRAILEGWAVVASAAHTLARALVVPADAALAAVQFELETLLPAVAPPGPRAQSPDVPVASLYRRT